MARKPPLRKGAFRLSLKRRGCSFWQRIENIPKTCHKPRQGRAEQDAFKGEETVIVDEAYGVRGIEMEEHWRDEQGSEHRAKLDWTECQVRQEAIGGCQT